jgi:inner membrane protein
MGRRTAGWKSALWGGVAGTLPDLGVFPDFGDTIRNMTFHRAESHSLLYLTLLPPVLAWGSSRLHGEASLFRRWWLGLWLALFTHPRLDWLAIYGIAISPNSPR